MSQRVCTPRTKERVTKRAGGFIKPEHIDSVGGWLKAAPASESAKFDRVFARLSHEAAPAAHSPSSPAPSSPRGGARSGSRSGSRSGARGSAPPTSGRVSRAGLLGSTRAVDSYGSTFERSTYTNDFRKYAKSAAPAALIPQHKHTRLDDFDQRVPPSTYRDDFVNHLKRSKQGKKKNKKDGDAESNGEDDDDGGIQPDERLLKNSASIARMKSLARGPPQSMYSTDFHPFSKEQQEVTRVKSVKPLHGRPTLGRNEDKEVRKYMLASMYGKDFVDHNAEDWAALANQTAQLEADAAAKASSSDAAETIYQRSFRNKGNPGELRGRAVRSLYSARGGLPGVPDLNGRDAASEAVRLSMLRTTYDNDFNGQAQTAESMQRLYADLVSDAAKPEVAAWLANEATPAEKAEFKDVLVQLNRVRREEEAAQAPRSHMVGGHKFFT